LQAGDRLSGDWVILGGAVLHLLNLDIRVTTDIDIAGPVTATTKDTIVLMDIASELGLPVEAINQAASYFLFKIAGWEKSLVLIHEGQSARILRPDVNLFLQLKISRLSESDLMDCLAILEAAAELDESLDKQKIYRLIMQQSKTEKNTNRLQRLGKLKLSLG
jgi:hypothetical protein